MLRRIEIRGFKSFGAAVTLDLGPGVNVIVGPNGSGKSNLAEAIVWALGEQRPSRVRAGGWGDVIFSGSAQRPPAGLAEVTLLLAPPPAPDGSDGPAELQSSRRLTRAGDTGYRLNGASCRLLDLHDALAERGLGPDSFAIIRQGQVESICSSRPPELRAIIEEAAGVGVPKRRRKRAEAKLARVADKLDRARDLAGEVASRAKQLERQARAAERAEEIERELAEAHSALALARSREALAALDRARRDRTAAAATASSANEALEAARADRARMESSRSDLAGRVGVAESLAGALRTASDRVAARAELAAERVVEAESRAERRASARRRARERLTELTAAVAAAQAHAVRAGEAADAAVARARETEAADMDARSAHHAARDGAARAGAALGDADRALAASARAFEQAQARRVSAAARLEELAPAPDEVDLDRAERRAELGAARSTRHRERVEAAERALADARAVRDAADARVRETRAGAAALKPERDDRSHGRAHLTDGLEVEAGMERAVAAALGALADAPMAEDLESARRLLDEGEPAAVVPPVNGRPVESAPAPAGCTPVAAALRATAPAARVVLERLLADAWLVDTLDDAPSDHAGVFVTRDGLALRPRTGTLARVAGQWARRAMHRRALEAVEAAEADVAVARDAQALAEKARAGAERRRRAADRCGARAGESLAAARARAAQRAAGVQEATEALRAADAAIREAEAARVGADAERRRAADAHRAAVAAADAARPGADAASIAHRDASSAVADAQAEVAGARTAAAEAEARLAALRAEAGSSDAGADLDIPRRAAEALADLAESLAPHVTSSRGALDAARAELAGFDRDLAGAAGTLAEAEGAASMAGEQAMAAEVALALAEERAAAARAAMTAPAGGDEDAEGAGDAPTHEPDLPANVHILRPHLAGAGAPAPMDEPLDVLEGRVDELERRRRAIGAVNPLAAAERAELGEREELLVSQVEDLEATSVALRQHMAELDGAVGDRFDAVFRTVSDRFQEVAELLFPGGQGRLVAVEDEDGEPGVEVRVVPGGKKEHSLSLLSGGEKSLVALAFCLALAMARPAPFYLLDEVEAALDDVNLRRFLGLVRRLAERTQFVLVTHQQPTVEISDTLFGVTLAGDGSSQVLARRLARSVEGPARPFVRRALSAVPPPREAGGAGGR